MAADFGGGVYQQLGELRADVKRLVGAEERNIAERRRGYERDEAIERQLIEVMRKLDELGSRMAAVEPVVDDIGKWRERFIGMRLLIVTISATFGALLVTGGKWLAVKLGWV